MKQSYERHPVRMDVWMYVSREARRMNLRRGGGVGRQPGWPVRLKVRLRRK